MDFKALYDQSIRDRLTIFEEQIIQISDDMSKDYKTVMVKGKERRQIDPEVVARAKLRVDARFRYLKIQTRALGRTEHFDRQESG